MAKAKVGMNKRGTGKKGEQKASKGGAKKSQPQLATVAAREQACLSLTTAAFIVGGCLPSGSHGNDDTLEETGLVTPHLRLIFRECVFNGVAAAGCEIDRGQIPNDADTKIGEVIDAVFQNSH
jgi:hypothetical protein